ncbi:MAG: hypothetical protein JNK48_13895 [Bryobacterales bacterium]|nr:hypothetical protein [Bryobacterales bacterium]
MRRLDQLLKQASKAGYYRRRQLQLPAEGPLTDDLVLRTLQSLPRVELDDFLGNPVEFFNWHHAPRPLRPLDCPLGAIGRTALLADGFEESESLRTFTCLSLEELEDYEPDSIAGPVWRLKNLAELALAGRLRLDSLRGALLVFTGLKHGCLKTPDRDLLWRAFQVPVFEQFRGFSQELLAWECEAHDGLHIHSENAVFELPRDGELVLTALACEEYSLLRVGTELTGRLCSVPCGCGNPAQRLIDVKPLRAPALAMAMTAGLSASSAR